MLLASEWSTALLSLPCGAVACDPVELVRSDKGARVRGRAVSMMMLAAGPTRIDDMCGAKPTPLR